MRSHKLTLGASFPEPDWTQVSEDGLLDVVRLILSHPGELDRGQREQLEAINREIAKREPEERRRYKREKMRGYRLRDKLAKMVADSRDK
jgi:hypothetical protein